MHSSRLGAPGPTWAAPALLAVLITACGGSSVVVPGTRGTTSSGGNGGGENGGTTSAAGGTGGIGGIGGGNPVEYPPGPYGTAVGATIANLGFEGFPAPQVSVDASQLVHLGDFYNPTGQGQYRAGSPHGAGATMPRLLMLHAAAVWSGPSNVESDTVIPAALAAYAPCLLFVDVLMYGATTTPGTVTLKNAASWAQKFTATYPVVIDPGQQLLPILVEEAFPTNILIETTGMTIRDVLSGAPDDPYFQNNVAPVCQ